MLLGGGRLQTLTNERFVLLCVSVWVGLHQNQSPTVSSCILRHAVRVKSPHEELCVPEGQASVGLFGPGQQGTSLRVVDG